MCRWSLHILNKHNPHNFPLLYLPTPHCLAPGLSAGPYNFCSLHFYAVLKKTLLISMLSKRSLWCNRINSATQFQSFFLLRKILNCALNAAHSKRAFCDRTLKFKAQKKFFSSFCCCDAAWLGSIQEKIVLSLSFSLSLFFSLSLSLSLFFSLSLPLLFCRPLSLCLRRW